MKTRTMICGSMMVLLAACSGSSDDGADTAGSETANPPAANASANAPATPATPAPPASPAPESPSPGEPPAEQGGGAIPAKLATAVVAVLPADGAIGVALTPKVKVTFSQAMDRASSEAAFSIEGAGPLTGAFTWSDGDTVLEFTPSNPVANGSDLTVKVAVGAKDKEGTNLASPFSSAFRTLRKSTVDLSAGTVVQCTATGGSIYIGQFFVGDDAANKEYRSFATFDLSTLPEDLTSIDSAWLNLRNGTVVGKSGPAVAESVDLGPSIDCADDFAKAPRTFYNPFTKQNLPLRSAIEEKGDPTLHAANLALAIAMDWNDRVTLGKRSMVRVQMAATPAADAVSDGMKWDGASKLTRPTLSVTFQHP